MSSNLSALKLWVVDDDRDLCEAYEAYLSEYFRVTGTYYDAQSTLDALLSMNPGDLPDVILLDQGMPGMDGITLAKEIGLRKIKVNIVLATGYEPVFSQHEKNELGLCAVLHKPCSPTLIKEAIENCRPNVQHQGLHP